MLDVFPSQPKAQTLYDNGTAQVLSTRLVADLETPISAYLKLTGGQSGSFLLESVEGGAVRGRYTIIGFAPDILWRCTGNKAEIAHLQEGLAAKDAVFETQDLDALPALRQLLRSSLIDLPEDLPPMAAGLVGYMGYDMVRLMEDLGPGNPDPYGLPSALFVRPTVMAIFDSVTDRITLVTPIRPKAGISAAEAYERGVERLQSAVTALERPLPMIDVAEDQPASDGPADITSHTGLERYREMVASAKEHMAAGDIFQVVLAQRFSVPFTLPPFALYRTLRRLNPSPFLYFLNFDEAALVGSSPEILVRLRDNEVTIRPIAGTRPRGKDAQEDEALAADLLADPKELSEHLMLLDLGRNDVGRVSIPGSVQVTQRNLVEKYSHVMHIVSNVTGTLDSDHYDAVAALEAGFPAGTVSGAPKIRAMEIIDELESEGRGPYAGAVGYFAANGSMDTCIVLRTAVVKDGTMHVHAGAGLVADSVPESEHLECENKARALFRAAEEAVHFAARPGRGPKLS
ncbi:anthranilate synthase component I [Iodidimonas gelatinilytica]|uniref:Anthranilate synthase component 1 n=1 Tax=Iodidimonas gelatinilytica TaxID=1236966 RepID=A0A5A7MLL7_9PROT|nr:anthranilate synthase component I [Iodidimonas gelatinilytica]GEQ96817.1 anthranilate synthase component I [Iodidimonas gelatinilytica]GER01191.1 anthranilate synthase component I [Iodidimonas gelatinilytica]